jgi:ankyrin repeat protein
MMINSILFQAVASNDIEMVEKICKNGFNADHWEYWEPSLGWGDLSGALEKAVENQNVEIVKLILNCDNNKINTVKHSHVIDSMKIAYGTPNILLCDILWSSLDNNQWGVDAETIAELLGYAVFSGNISVIEHILKKGANVNCLTGWGSPLTIAVAENKFDVVDVIIRNGADPNFNNQEENAGYGALSTAALNNFKELYQYLLPFVSDEDEIEYSKLILGYSSIWSISDEDVAEWGEVL